MPDQDRAAPASPEAERAIFGTILLESDSDNDAFKQAAEILAVQDFFNPAHRAIFGAMTSLSKRREPIDQVTLKNELERRGEMHAVGGAAYVASLIDGVPSASNVAHYARII